MITKRRSIFASATIVALAMVLTASAVLAAKPAAKPAASGNVLWLTHNGSIVGVSKPPCIQTPAGGTVCANDLHFVWKYSGKCANGIELPPVIVLWTINGQLVYNGKPTVAPCRANDFEFGWDANGNVNYANWTYNGRVIMKIPLPVTTAAGINDAHIFWLGGGQLLKAYWTLNGKPYGPSITVPKGTNDAHWVLG